MSDLPVIDVNCPPARVVWCPDPDTMHKALDINGISLVLTPFTLSERSKLAMSEAILTERYEDSLRHDHRYRPGFDYLLADEMPFRASQQIMRNTFVQNPNSAALRVDIERGLSTIQRALHNRPLSFRLESQLPEFVPFEHGDDSVAGGTLVLNGQTMSGVFDTGRGKKRMLLPENTIGVWYGNHGGPDHPALRHTHGTMGAGEKLRSYIAAFDR